MIEAVLNAVHSTASLNESEPLVLAMNMEQSRQTLLLLLLAEDQASALLLNQWLSHVDRNLDISEIVSDKPADAIIVQGAGFVQPDLVQTVQYLLENPAARSSLAKLHFLPGFLIEVSALRQSAVSHKPVLTDYLIKLGQAAKDLQRLRQQMIAGNIRLVAFVKKGSKKGVRF